MGSNLVHENGQNRGQNNNCRPESQQFEGVAPSDIISNLFLEDLEKIRELKKWIPDPCNNSFIPLGGIWVLCIRE